METCTLSIEEIWTRSIQANNSHHIRSLLSIYRPKLHHILRGISYRHIYITTMLFDSIRTSKHLQSHLHVDFHVMKEDMITYELDYEKNIIYVLSRHIYDIDDIWYMKKLHELGMIIGIPFLAHYIAQWGNDMWVNCRTSKSTQYIELRQ